MSTEERIEQLMRVIGERTQARKLKWEATPDEDSFRLRSNVANVLMTRREEYVQDAEEYLIRREFSVVNDKGRVVEEYWPSTPVKQREFDSLFTEARRSAFETDAVLEQLMKELQKSTQ